MSWVRASYEEESGFGTGMDLAFDIKEGENVGDGREGTAPAATTAARVNRKGRDASGIRDRIQGLYDDHDPTENPHDDVHHSFISKKPVPSIQNLIRSLGQVVPRQSGMGCKSDPTDFVLSPAPFGFFDDLIQEKEKERQIILEPLETQQVWTDYGLAQKNSVLDRQTRIKKSPFIEDIDGLVHTKWISSVTPDYDGVEEERYMHFPARGKSFSAGQVKRSPLHGKVSSSSSSRSLPYPCSPSSRGARGTPLPSSHSCMNRVGILTGVWTLQSTQIVLERGREWHPKTFKSLSKEIVPELVAIDVCPCLHRFETESYTLRPDHQHRSQEKQHAITKKNQGNTTRGDRIYHTCDNDLQVSFHIASYHRTRMDGEEITQDPPLYNSGVRILWHRDFQYSISQD